jgi:DNA-binding FadR family transcriptional regulator
VTSSRAETAAGQIEGLISDRLRPGDRLGTKDDLRVLTGVAVGTLNEAIRLLVSRGLVTLRPGPGGGLFVARPTPVVRLGAAVLALTNDDRTAGDALLIRDALEPLVIADAVRHATDADVAELRALVDELGEAVADVARFLEVNWRLHVRMARISPNAMLRSIYGSLLDTVTANTGQVTAQDERTLVRHKKQRHRLHADIVEAIAAKDEKWAARLARKHSQAVHTS